MTAEFLREIRLFAGLPTEDLERLADLAERIELKPGEDLVREGDPGHSMYVLMEGECRVTKRSGSREVLLAERGPGEVIGEMALLSEAPRSATITAVTPMKVLRLEQDAFQSVLRSSPEAALAILDTMTGRLRDTESVLRHHEKLSALGTLAAGLAHEINNPAGAIQSAADQLSSSILDLAASGPRLEGIWSDPEKGRRALALLDNLARGEAQPITGLERSDREAQMEEALESAGVPDAWRFVGPLVAAGWTAADLQPLQKKLGAAHLQVVTEWLAQAAEALTLTEEIGQAARRIGSIVQSVKSYAYLDQAPEQVIDVNKSLEDTLVILRHKLADGVHVDRQFSDALPRVEGLGSELTQVWTNLLDNAIDAMEGQGNLALITRPSDGGIEVLVCDDGPGIPDKHLDRIFEAFYTTKGPGEGSGLGLHMVYNIVVQRHGGSVEVESEPGRTCFRVWLPAGDLASDKPASD